MGGYQTFASNAMIISITKALCVQLCRLALANASGAFPSSRNQGTNWTLVPDALAGNFVPADLLSTCRPGQNTKSWLIGRSGPMLDEPSVSAWPLMAERPVVLPPYDMGDRRGSDLSYRHCARDRSPVEASFSSCHAPTAQNVGWLGSVSNDYSTIGPRPAE